MSDVVVASIDNIWSRHFFNKLSHLLGPEKIKWVKDDGELSFALDQKPKWVFFFHWSSKVAASVFENNKCVVLHTSNLPEGRGGSPIQNLILRNHKTTIITALKMTDVLDAGPIYLKRKLKLNGNAQKIYERASKKVFKMINIIVKKEIMPVAQKGKVVKFKRRKPKQSILSKKINSLKELYNHIRMLDAKTYPPAFIQYGKLRIEFKKAKINGQNINASVSIKLN